MDNSRGRNAALGEERWLFVGRHLCYPPSPEHRGDPGALFNEVERVVLLKVTALTARHPYCIQPQHSKAVDAEALASQGSKLSSGDGGLSIAILIPAATMTDVRARTSRDVRVRASIASQVDRQQLKLCVPTDVPLLCWDECLKGALSFY
jgi:hypothetical protein